MQNNLNEQYQSIPPAEGTSTIPASENTYNASKEDVKRIENWMIAVVIFVAVIFVIEIYTINLDRIKDKDLYLRYNDLYQKYSDENLESREIINNQKIEINNLWNEFKLLRAKNPYLK
mgnify:CR=1 FL=1